MTTACAITLGIALALYLAAALLFQGQFLLHKHGWDAPGRKSLGLGLAVHLIGMILHLMLSGQSPFTSMLVIISWLVVALVVGALVGAAHMVGAVVVVALGRLLASMA